MLAVNRWLLSNEFGARVPRESNLRWTFIAIAAGTPLPNGWGQQFHNQCGTVVPTVLKCQRAMLAVNRWLLSNEFGARVPRESNLRWTFIAIAAGTPLPNGWGQQFHTAPRKKRRSPVGKRRL